MNIVLIGFMGTGKTAVSRLLSEKLGWALYDIDRMIESQTGMTISEIFSKTGESSFRHLETETIRLVSLLDKSIISTGGGAPLYAENMEELMKKGMVFCLTAQPKIIFERLRKEIQIRPLLKDKKDPLKTIEDLLRVRRTAYGRCHHTIQTDDLTTEEVADKILSLIESKK